MIFFKPQEPKKDEKKENLQVNVDLGLITKMNQEFAVSLDLNDTLKTALQVIIARINAGDGIFLLLIFEGTLIIGKFKLL